MFICIVLRMMICGSGIMQQRRGVSLLMTATHLALSYVPDHKVLWSATGVPLMVVVGCNSRGKDFITYPILRTTPGVLTLKLELGLT
jgi:hypothetical protein